MQTVILVIHILACVALTAVVLLQRSEGGALGIGGGGGAGGGLMSGRGAAGALVRTTMIFAGVFFVTSLTLTTLANMNNDDRSAAERELESDTGAGGVDDILDTDTPLLDDPLSEGDESTAPEPPADPLAEGDAAAPADPLAEEPGAGDDPQGGDGAQDRAPN